MSRDFTPEECARVRDELGALVDEALSPSEATTTEQHLVVCADCAAELALLRWLTRSIARLPRPEPDPAMRARLLAHARAEGATPYRVQITRLEQGPRSTVHTQVAGALPKGVIPRVPTDAMASIGRPVMRWSQRVTTAGPGRYHMVQTVEWR